MKIKFSLIILIVFINTLTEAQYTKLLDFNNTNGTQPFGSVILSSNDSTLYGMTNGGGAISNSAGVIYSIKTDGTGFQNLHTFTADAASGSWPYGSLIRAGNILYGMTSGYGANGMGTIFSINTNGTGYTKLHDFGGSVDSSGNPYGTLTLSGNILYGTTYGGGGDKGSVFSIHTDGAGYTLLLYFNGANGQFPGYGALTLSGNVLYGTTLYGGTNGLGVLYSIHTDGTAYNKLLDFNTANGETPYTAPILSGNILYGVSNGGANGKGIIYSIHTDGTAYNKILEFNSTNAQSPYGGLTLSGNTLFGTTSAGGTNVDGIVFSINTDGSGFQTLYNFDGTNGQSPRSTLTLSGTTLYGTTVIGGAFDDGVVFSLKTHPPAPSICMVTVDSASMNNIIYWDKTSYTNVDSFIVYRETFSNTYKRIGAVSKDSISMLTDTVRHLYFTFSGNPNSGTYRYKLQIRDLNGNYSLLSPYQNTIFVTQTGGTFNWNAYQIEGEATPIPELNGYFLYRDNISNGNWTVVNGVSGSQLTITDPDYASYPHASWRIETVWSISCTPTRSINSARSNIEGHFLTGLSSYNEPEGIVNAYPNPYSGTTTIMYVLNKKSDVNVEVYNTVGQKVALLVNASQTPGEYKCSFSAKEKGFGPGIYFVKISVSGKTAMQRIVEME